MLTLINGSEALPLLVDDYYVRQVDSGYDQLKFSISIYDEMYQKIQEESVIREQSDVTSAQRYIVKAIDGGAENAQIIAEVDLDEWKSTLTVNYASASATVGAILNAVKPAGWTVTDSSGLSITRTITLEAARPIDVADACRSTFDVCLRWNNVSKTVTIINPKSYTATGEFITKDLNLKENNYKGKSSDFATRLYAYGAEGLTFADINQGKPYVDNNTYSDKVVCAYWKDERYTVKANLLYDATAKLAEMAIPSRSYDCSVYDLARTDPARYSYLDFSLFTVVALIDTTRANAKIYHQIVELWIYPYHPNDNKVILSTSPAKIQSQLSNLASTVMSPNSDWNQEQKQEQSAAIDKATQQITGNTGGNVLIGLNAQNQPYEICIMNTMSKATASKVWRWNLSGLGYSSNGYNGPYGLAMTQDGAIVADYIRTGALSSSNVTVGGFTLSSTSLHNGMTSLNDTTHNGVYVGTDGIALGRGNFKVDAAGNLVAKTATIEGQMNITSGSINIGNAFMVDSSGNLTANSGTFKGNVYANKISVGGSAGYISGSQIGSSTITGSNIGNGTISGSNIGASTISGSNIGSETITGNNVANYTISGTKVGESTLSTFNTDYGINTSLGYANFSADVFSGTQIASHVGCSSLVVDGSQFVGRLFSFKDYYGNTRSFYGLLAPED